MNNPYRARPTRSRPDHTVGYGVQNQNMWKPMPRAQQEMVANDPVQHQPPMANQPNQPSDTWNSSWNWDFDKQTDPQQQQKTQQQQIITAFTVQDDYYQNANGNKSDLINQNLIPEKNPPGLVPGRQLSSNHNDSFVPYTNYTQNQQYPPTPRTNAMESNLPSSEHSQWGNEQQLQNMPHVQRTVPQNSKEQIPPPPLASHYNWSKPNQPNPTPPQTWQNYSNVPQWPETNVDNKMQHLDDLGNQCVPLPQQQGQIPPMLPPSSEDGNKEHSMNWSNNKQGSSHLNNWPNQSHTPTQWQNQKREAAVPNHLQQQPVQSYETDNEVNAWSQQGQADTSQWNQSNEWPTNQWWQRKEETNAHTENMEQGNNSATADENPQNQPQSSFSVSSIAPDECLHNRPPSHYSMSSTASGADSLTDRDERKKSIATFPPTSLPPKDVPVPPKPVEMKTQLSEPYHVPPPPESTTTHSSFDNVPLQDNNDFNLTRNDSSEWGRKELLEDLPAQVEQMSLGPKGNKPFDNQTESAEAHQSISGDGWGQEPVPSFNINTSQNNSVPENIPVLPADYTAAGIDSIHSNDNHITVAQEVPLPSPYPATSGKSMDSVSQSGYEQWYNQNALPLSSENACYAQDQGRPPKQWTAEQNVENYENIQQPSEFVNLEVVSPAIQKRDLYGSRDSINKETLDNDPKPVVNSPKEAATARDFRQEINNVEVPSMAQQQPRPHPPLQPPEHVPDNYEFASNDRNTFLETGELTDSHQDHEPTPPNQDDENDEVPNDIPFLREVPGQSSSTDPRRNDPTGQEQYVQSTQRLPDPRRNDPSGQEQGLPLRNVADRSERRDVPPGQERGVPILSRSDSDTFERRNDPSGRERSLPPQQSRNDPSGEERYQSQSQIILEPTETREVPGRGNEPEEPVQPADDNLRQIPGGASPNEVIQAPDDLASSRVVTGSQEVASSGSLIPEQTSDTRNKREEAVGASIGEVQGNSLPPNRRDSYEDEGDESSGNSRDDSRERRRDSSQERRRYEYERKNTYDYEREREYDDSYYYDRRRGAESDRAYSTREELERRELSYREDDRKHHSRDDLDRHPREELDRRNRAKDDVDERDSRRRPEDRRRERGDVDMRRRERDVRDYDPRYPRDRDFLDRDRRRDERRPRRYEDYENRDPYRREYYDDPYGRSSRPSSRSSYNDRDREYYMRSRDPYYGYNGYPGYDYGSQYNSNYYAYLENLRRTNPAAYYEWYQKYYANQHHQQHMTRAVGNYPEDRASVHSGRSSCDDRFFANPTACFYSSNKALYVPHFGCHGWAKSPLHRRSASSQTLNRNAGDKRTLGDMSLIEDSVSASARMTPTMYSTSHTYGCFSIGSLVHVHASYPADGERARVDILALDNLLSHDPVARDLRAYPGPLIKGVTHKKTIIEYCEGKIKKAAANEDMADRASYILLYELMIMLIQQNGNVVGVDIAALLLRNKDAYPYDHSKQKSHDKGRRESVISQRSSVTGGEPNVQDVTAVTEKTDDSKARKTIEQITDEFRDTLLYGLVQEALEYAMNEGLWGHALFLASKLDKRTHASVMTRFANSLPHNDPLQTLYQLHSGRVPSVVTCVTDPRWDDWRPHLAMIISNTSANPEINRRSITTLGDTLSVRGDIYAAHFCYILAQLDFGAYGANNVKLVLIGTNHHKPYAEFLTTEAVMLTEIYEYARNLCEPGFTLVDLQTFKFDLAVKMVDYGLIEKALLYAEQIAVNIVNQPSKYKKTFIDSVYTLGDRIKYHDPIYKDSIDDAASLTWLSNLREIVGKCQTGEIQNDAHGAQLKAETQPAPTAQEVHEVKQQQQQWNAVQPEYSEGPVSMMEVPPTEGQAEWQPMSLPTNLPDTYEQNTQYLRTNDELAQYQQQPQQQDYWNQDSYYQPSYGGNEMGSSQWQQQSSHTPYSSDQTDMDGTQQQEKWNYEPLQPAISMTPSAKKQYDPLEELDALETPKQSGKSASGSKKATEKPTEKKTSNSGGSWFGGLFSKLAPKPRNQMILPDDSDPTIVWDSVGKKWINKDENGDSGSTSLAPPPKAAEMGFRPPVIEQPPQQSQPTPQLGEAAPTNPSKLPPIGSNMFKLPKGRSMRANYIDVMNPNGTKGSASPNMPTPVTSPMLPMATSSPQLFIPAPVNDPNAPVDFLTPSATPAVQSANHSETASQGLSRWSSTSSLSREVQSYTMRDPRHLPRNKGPMMYNPNDMKDRSARNMQQSRNPPR